jgi:hypothetical protein
VHRRRIQPRRRSRLTSRGQHPAARTQRDSTCAPGGRGGWVSGPWALPRVACIRGGLRGQRMGPGSLPGRSSAAERASPVRRSVLRAGRHARGPRGRRAANPDHGGAPPRICTMTTRAIRHVRAVGCRKSAAARVSRPGHCRGLASAHESAGQHGSTAGPGELRIRGKQFRPLLQPLPRPAQLARHALPHP